MVAASEMNPAISVLVHIGTDSRARLAGYLDSAVSRLVLVEPLEEEAALLKADLAGDERVQVVRGFVAEGGGEAELRRWNMDGLASLREATPLLLELLPGLRITAREQMPLITPPDLLAAAGIAGAQFDLVVEFSGEEQDFLAAWQAHGLLEKTKTIRIRIAEEPFFAGAASRPVVEAWLVDAGFEVVERDLSDPDWPVLILRADEAGRALRATEERIAALEEALAETEAAQAARDKTLSAREEALKLAEDRAEELEKALAQAVAAQTARDKAVAKREASAMSEVEAARRAADEQAAQHAQQLAEISAARIAAETALAEMTASRDAAVKAGEDTGTALEAATAQVAQRDAALAEAQGLLSAKTAALAERDAALKAAEEQKATLTQELADVAAARGTLEKQAAEVKLHLANAATARDSAKKAHADTIAALEAAKAQTTERDATLAEVQALLSAKTAALAERDAALKVLEERAAELKIALDEAQAAIGKAKRQAADEKRQRDKAYADLGVSARMQGLLQSDLVDLRSRLQESERVRAEHEALLRKLTPRLQQAADQLRSLQMLESSKNDHPSIAARPRAKIAQGSRGRNRKRANKAELDG